jgi:hypothetical protein
MPELGSPPPGLLEGYVQVPPDSTGKQLRAFPISVYYQNADGTFSAETFYQQVLVLADADGNLLGVQAGNPVLTSDSDSQSLLGDILEELRWLHHYFERKDD